MSTASSPSSAFDVLGVIVRAVIRAEAAGTLRRGGLRSLLRRAAAAVRADFAAPGGCPEARAVIRGLATEAAGRIASSRRRRHVAEEIAGALVRDLEST